MINKEVILGGLIAGMAIMIVVTVAVRVVLWYATVNKERNFCKLVKPIALVLFAFISPDYAFYLDSNKKSGN